MADTAYLHTLDPFLIQFPGGFGLRWYGLAYLAGFMCAYWTLIYMARRGLTPLKEEVAGDYVFTVAIGTIAGGRLGYCIFYAPNLLTAFDSHFPFWGVLKINEGGMASHGAIIAMIFCCIIFGIKHGVSKLHLCDLMALTGTIGIFFGRVANFINGELVGRPVESAVAWAVKFPQDIMLWPAEEPDRLLGLAPLVEKMGITAGQWQEWIGMRAIDSHAWNSMQSALYGIIDKIQGGDSVLADALRPLLTARHPSQLYEALGEGLILFVILLFIWRKPRRPGVVGSWFCSLYAVARITCEQFRMPDPQIGYQMFGLTRGQILSFFFLAFGLIYVNFCARRPVEPIGGWGAKSAEG